MVVVGSGVLALVNALSINLSALAVLWYSGYRPERWFQLGEARTAMLKRIAVLAVAIAVLSVFLGGVTYDSYQAATTEDAIRDEVEIALEGTGAELFGVEVVRSDGIIFRHSERVVVTVGVSPDDQPPDLAPRIATRVSPATERDVDVQVRYVTFGEAS